MREFFNMDNGLFRFLGKVADLMILNMLFILFSIPVITIGASTTAMHYVALKMAEQEEGYIARGFLKSFKENFRQATVIWLIVLVAGIVLVADIAVLWVPTTTFMKVLRVLILAFLIIYLIIVSYIFPILARFENSVKNTFKNAVIMSIVHLPYSLLLLVITIAPILLTLLNGYTMWYGVLVWILAGFSGCTLLKCYCFKRIFVNYMPEQDDADADPDYWVLDEGENTENSESETVSEVIAEQPSSDSDIHLS